MCRGTVCNTLRIVSGPIRHRRELVRRKLVNHPLGNRESDALTIRKSAFVAKANVVSHFVYGSVLASDTLFRILRRSVISVVKKMSRESDALTIRKSGFVAKAKVASHFDCGFVLASDTLFRILSRSVFSVISVVKK